MHKIILLVWIGILFNLPQGVMAAKLSDRLEKIHNTVEQKYKSVQTVIDRFRNHDLEAWQKDMEKARVAIDRKDFGDAKMLSQAHWSMQKRLAAVIRD